VLRLDGQVVYAASDLNDFLACDHRVALNRRVLIEGGARPADDPTLAIIARKGQLHEQAVLARLEASGVAVVRIDEGDGSRAGLERAAQATRQAMRAGAQAIYQATLLDGRWMGRADFLMRTDVPSGLGSWSYDVADAKLAVREKAAFVVQLCVYADLVASVQGALPRTITALLGDGNDVPYVTERYVAYARAARARFEAAVDGLDAALVPDRVAACGTCAWAETCDAARRNVDHLALVAGIRRTQIARLREAGVTTVASLAHAASGDRPARLAETTFAKLQRQAELQLDQRATGVPSYRLLEPRPNAGFALLPEPDDADVYFDMEGDPLYEPGTGLEYLFGTYVHGAQPAYREWWGETREQEKVAFEAFVDWLVRHRNDHPRAHVYHYAPYEKTALRKLAMRHGTREDEVDALLREQVLIDLYAVVGGAVAQSQESYSIKKLEPLYGFTRSTDVRKGDDSIVAFERYLQDREVAIRADIITYNEEDCVSTFGLHRWLRRLRDEACRQFGREVPYRAPVDPQEPTEKERKEAAARTALQDALLARSQDGDPERLLAHVLGYYRREKKPVQWALFERHGKAGAFDFVAEDDEALGELELCVEIPATKDPARPRSAKQTYTYRFPRQQHKLGLGPVDVLTKKVVDVIGIDDDEGLARLALMPGMPHPRTLIPGWPIDSAAQEAALARLATAVLDGSAPQRYGAALALLRNEPPRITGLVPGDFVQPTLRPGAAAIDPADVASLALRLDDATLVVQGPPGSGKTYTGAHVIADLLAANKRVGVTATGHQAIHNLLHEVERVVADRGESFRGVKKGGGDDAFSSRLERPFIESVTNNAPFGEYDLVAGTAWLLSREELAKLDVLVIDEAGQVALADALAMATCARNLVLLGDPMQLAHVSVATHPQDAGVSVLTHMLGDSATIAPDRGVFLDRSFRMAPPLCRFISALAYEGRLEPASSCAAQRIASRAYTGAGLLHVPVVHEGNAQSSEEEADAVATLMDGLIGGSFTACDGATRTLQVDDILVVSPYNQQVSLLRRTLRARFGDGVRVGTVDKFQGQEAPVVIYSLAASSVEDAPRGADFLLEENRFNVAVSRGRALAVLVCSPRITATPCTSIEQLRAVAAFCTFVEMGGQPAVPAAEVPMQLPLLLPVA
jgi:predicted RecB family nuclease